MRSINEIITHFGNNHYLLTIMILSIVTITYNNLSGLQKTFDSLNAWLIDRDNNHWFEWIVIDGGSKDGSVEFLNRHNQLID